MPKLWVILFLITLGISPQELAAQQGAGKEIPQPATAMEMQMVAQEDMGQWLTEKTGSSVALDAMFTDSQGRRYTLRELITKPTLLLPVYFYCPKTCTFDLANLAAAIRRSAHPASDYQVIALSFNAQEGPEDAALAKPNYLQLAGDNFPKENWHFLVGDQENIDKLTRSIGYRVKPQDDGTFIHPSALVALGLDGQIIKYVYGSFVPGDVDLAIGEAIKGTPATSIKRLLSFCFNYNPQKNQGVFSLLKIGALVTMVIAGLFFFFFLGRKKKS